MSELREWDRKGPRHTEPGWEPAWSKKHRALQASSPAAEPKHVAFAADGGSVAVVEPKHILSPEPAMSSALRNKDRRAKQRTREEAPAMASDELAAAGEWAHNAADGGSVAVVEPKHIASPEPAMSSAQRNKDRRAKQRTREEAPAKASDELAAAHNAADGSGIKSEGAGIKSESAEV